MTVRGRLAAAALASLALHALVIAGNWLPVPQPADTLRPLEARLAPLPEPKPDVPRPRVRTPRHSAPAPVPPVPSVAAVGPLPVPEPQPETAPAEIAAPEPPQRLALAAESSSVIARSLPRRGRITYTLLYGDTRSYIGKVVQAWEVEDGAYRISSDAETGGIVELFRPQRLRYVSQGRVTREGLRPESFLMSRTRRGQNEAAQARFDWSAGSLTYGLAREQKNVSLPAGAQDFMSFIYQFVLAPPAPGRYRIPITTGSRFDVYEIEVSEEAAIETPIGTLKALPVKQLPRPGAESIEIWLAADYRYLPVRIRHFDREGRYSGEQMVSEIRISEE
jgi:hypothetical protein